MQPARGAYSALSDPLAIFNEAYGGEGKGRGMDEKGEGEKGVE